MNKQFELGLQDTLNLTSQDGETSVSLFVEGFKEVEGSEGKPFQVVRLRVRTDCYIEKRF